MGSRLKRNSQALAGAFERPHSDKLFDAFGPILNIEITLLPNQLADDTAIAAHGDARIPHPRQAFLDIHYSIPAVRCSLGWLGWSDHRFLGHRHSLDISFQLAAALFGSDIGVV